MGGSGRKWQKQLAAINAATAAKWMQSNSPARFVNFPRVVNVPAADRNVPAPVVNVPARS